MGHELADDDKLFLRASMMAELTDNLTILINGDYHEVDESTSIFRSLRSVLGGFIALESTNPDFYVGNDFRSASPFAIPEKYNVNARGDTLNLGSVDLTSITKLV